MLSNNPTRTLGIERAWNSQITKRFRKLTQALRSGFIAEFTTNKLEIDAERTQAYIAYLQSKIDELITREDWQSKYQVQAYLRGIERSRAELRKQGSTLQATPLEAATAAFATTIVPSLLTGTTSVGLLPPIHTEALAYLQTRAYESLKGWTDKFSREVRVILVDGALAGRGPRVLAKEIQEKLKTTEARARLIAQTETVQAFQRSQIAQAEIAVEETGQDIQLRWTTRMDERVRPLHAGWHGTVATPQVMAQRITLSPYNCRCALIPVLMSASNTEARNIIYAKEREKLLKLLPAD